MIDTGVRISWAMAPTVWPGLMKIIAEQERRRQDERSAALLGSLNPGQPDGWYRPPNVVIAPGLAPTGNRHERRKAAALKRRRG